MPALLQIHNTYGGFTSRIGESESKIEIIDGVYFVKWKQESESESKL